MHNPSAAERNAAVDALTRLFREVVAIDTKKINTEQLLVIADTVLLAAEQVRDRENNPIAIAMRLFGDNQAKADLQTIVDKLGGLPNLMTLAPVLLRLFKVVVDTAAVNPQALPEIHRLLEHSQEHSQ